MDDKSVLLYCHYFKTNHILRIKRGNFINHTTQQNIITSRSIISDELNKRKNKVS